MRQTECKQSNMQVNGSGTNCVGNYRIVAASRSGAGTQSEDRRVGGASLVDTDNREGERERESCGDVREGGTAEESREEGLEKGAG